MKRASPLVLLAFLLFGTGTARAEAPDSAQDSASERKDLRITADTGMAGDDHGGGFMFAGEVLHRRGLLALGAVGEYGGQVFFSRYRWFGAGAGAGISLPTPSWIRIDLLGIAGVHRYDGVGTASLPFPSVVINDDPGVGATMPSLGSRLSIALELGGRARFVLGLKGFVDRDLGSMTRSRAVASGDVFSGSTTETRSDTVGATRIGAVLALGGTIGL